MLDQARYLYICVLMMCSSWDGEGPACKMARPQLQADHAIRDERVLGKCKRAILVHRSFDLSTEAAYALNSMRGIYMLVCWKQTWIVLHRGRRQLGLRLVDSGRAERGIKRVERTEYTAVQKQPILTTQYAQDIIDNCACS